MQPEVFEKMIFSVMRDQKGRPGISAPTIELMEPVYRRWFITTDWPLYVYQKYPGLKQVMFPTFGMDGVQ